VLPVLLVLSCVIYALMCEVMRLRDRERQRLDSEHTSTRAQEQEARAREQEARVGGTSAGVLECWSAGVLESRRQVRRSTLFATGSRDRTRGQTERRGAFAKISGSELLGLCSCCDCEFL
jgi:hypothetical protein